MDFLTLTLEPLSVDAILKLVSSEKCGAVSIFVGTTRDNFEGKQVVKLEYEAYEPMANKVMKNLCDEIRKKWDEIFHIAIYHRLGCVPVLEASIVIAISSPHRVDSLAAVQYCIENLKGKVPIWKKEVYSDRESPGSQWKENAECAWSTKKKKDFPVSYNFDNNTWSDAATHTPSHLVQINASNEEIQNRIKKYADKKREQINLSNIKDFIETNGQIKDNPQADSYSSCARVDAVLIKRKDSKSHLQVMRVQNEWGPQTKVEKPTQGKFNSGDHEKNSFDANSKCGIEERITNAEKCLNILKPIPKDIYQRLKTIEDRILELETISPEYSTFWLSKSSSANQQESDNRSTNAQSMNNTHKFSANDIKERIQAMERNNSVKYEH